MSDIPSNKDTEDALALASIKQLLEEVSRRTDQLFVIGLIARSDDSAKVLSHVKGDPAHVEGLVAIGLRRVQKHNDDVTFIP